MFEALDRGALCQENKCRDYENLSRELTEMKQLSKKLDAVLESSYDGIYITDGLGNTLRVNKAYERITGLKAEEFVGKNVSYLVMKGLISKSCSSLVLEQKKVVSLEQRLSTGKALWVTGTPIFDQEGKIEMVVTNVRDITEINELREQLQEKAKEVWAYDLEIKKLKEELSKENEKGFQTQNKNMYELLQSAKKVAEHETTVLITGETGVGKEVLTEYIHKHSERKAQKLVKVNCSAIPENLIESELFGYEKGAFTGANVEGKIGFFEEANGGTLFLDEIGELPYGMQAKLLRVLQESEIQRVGGTQPIKIDVRIVAATNRDLEEMAYKGEFRRDLYYRLNIVPLYVPPLKERREDIMVLAKTFVRELSQKYKKEKQLTEEAYALLYRYDWPGNIRELKNVIERTYVMAERDLLEEEDFPLAMRQRAQKMDLGEKTLKDALEEVERKLLEEAYQTWGNVRAAAKALGIDPSTFVRKRQKYAR